MHGGKERSDSVFNALTYLSQLAEFQKQDLVAVHDAARPCVLQHDLDVLFEKARQNADGAILAAAATDTIKQYSTEFAQISATLNRSTIAMAQTPQVFQASRLIEALSYCAKNGIAVTDESSAMEKLGMQPQLVFGSKSNIKITTSDDLALAAFYLQQQGRVTIQQQEIPDKGDAVCE